MLFGAVVADNVDDAVALEKKMPSSPTWWRTWIRRRTYLDHQGTDRKTVKSFLKSKRTWRHCNSAAPDTQPVDINALSSTLYSFYGYSARRWTKLATATRNWRGQFVSLRNTIEDLRQAMLAGDDNALEHADKLAAFQQGLFDDLRETFVALQNQDDRAPLRVEDLPPALRDQFVGMHGKFLLQVFPKKDVWQRANQQEFVETLRQAGSHDTNQPIITGTPVQLFEYESLLKDSYVTAAWYSLAAIALIVLIHFRSLAAVILALIPVGLGTLWLAGLMGWFKIPFNPANIMTLPLVIGIGVTNGIHILNRFAEEGTPASSPGAPEKRYWCQG